MRNKRLLVVLVLSTSTLWSGCAAFPHRAAYDSEIERAEKGEWGSVSKAIQDASSKDASAAQSEVVRLKAEALVELDALRSRAAAVKIVFLRSLLDEEIDREKVSYFEKQLEHSYRRKLQLIEALAEEMKRTRGLVEDDFKRFNGVFLRINM